MKIILIIVGTIAFIIFIIGIWLWIKEARKQIKTHDDPYHEM